jgi:hypothetical protein
MMNKRKNIDKLISEKLDGYEQIPPADVWNGISQGLLAKSKKPFLLPFWRIAAGIAILMGFGLSYLFINRYQNRPVENMFVENDSPSQTIHEDGSFESTINESSAIDQLIESESNKPLRKENLSHQSIVDKGLNEMELRTNVSEGHSERALKDSELKVHYPNLSAKDLPFQKELNYPDDIIILPKKTEILASWDMLHEDIIYEEVPVKDKFSLSASMSPLYSYRDIDGGGNSDNFNSAENGKVSYSGGLQFGVRQNKKLSFQTGVFYSRLGLGIDNIYAMTKLTGFGETLASSTYVTSNSIGQINSSNNEEQVISSNNNDLVMFTSTGGLISETGTATDARLEQYFHVLEVPFLARYNIIDRAVNVNILGGLSTNFIVGNEVYLSEGGTESYFGKTSSINTVNYSGNVGIGLDYEMNKNFLFSIEPVFKYYLNSINSENLISARPYNFGFYTGIRYIF